MSRIEIVRYEPCSHCNWNNKIELGEECGGPELAYYLFFDAPDQDWQNFPDLDLWHDLMKKISKKFGYEDWLPAEYNIEELLFYCPDCEMLKISANWKFWSSEGASCNREQKCECGTILQEIKTPHELNNLIVRCPNCCTPLQTIIITEDSFNGETKETYCYPRQGN